MPQLNPLKQMNGLSSKQTSLDDLRPTGKSITTIQLDSVDDPEAAFFNSIGAQGIRPTEPETIDESGGKK
ncbi:MAG: hypothetical protein KTR35_17595 [Gammaproteobacteria bacterium]|nr:hypothetical protein [Gammaproteobacteria bacterium]